MLAGLTQFYNLLEDALRVEPNDLLQFFDRSMRNKLVWYTDAMHAHIVEFIICQELQNSTS